VRRQFIVTIECGDAHAQRFGITGVAQAIREFLWEAKLTGDPSDFSVTAVEMGCADVRAGERSAVPLEAGP